MTGRRTDRRPDRQTDGRKGENNMSPDPSRGRPNKYLSIHLPSIFSSINNKGISTDCTELVLHANTMMSKSYVLVLKMLFLMRHYLNVHVQLSGTPWNLNVCPRLHVQLSLYIRAAGLSEA